MTVRPLGWGSWANEIEGMVADAIIDGPTPPRSRHGPKRLRLGARSDPPPDAGFTGTGSHGGQI